jgi:glutaredoxin-related protein
MFNFYTYWCGRNIYYERYLINGRSGYNYVYSQKHITQSRKNLTQFVLFMPQLTEKPKVRSLS